ncbi:amidase family protein [Micromonospora sp. NPDC049230]|uniref:amidase family protein n=1 Tax=Micromonospora sp. NPDC049230 TaxID=3155502 RepID=UPI0033C27B3D
MCRSVPTTPTTAVPIPGSSTIDTARVFMRYVFGVSVAGLPAVSLPAGADPAGLPVGVQLIGISGSDSGLLGLALAFERVLG